MLLKMMVRKGKSMGVGHYENFPVGSILLPKKLRKPVHAIYHFARTADDFADEGDDAAEVRLHKLDALAKELDLIREGKEPTMALMQRLQKEAIHPFSLDLEPFYDLLSAFKQDVEKVRYESFAELIDYARRSANPVGRLLLQLYGVSDTKSLAQSDGICTALQLINFWQDVAVDWNKGRVYIPQEDLLKYGVSEEQIAAGKVDFAFQRLMAYECERTHKMLKAGSPLVHALPGRLGFELRLIVLGGQRILHKLDVAKYDVYKKRPVLKLKDWWVIFKRAIQKK